MGVEAVIVDDDPVGGELMSELLSEKGFTPRLVDDSTKAVAVIKAEKPRLVILDILMPGLDGLTLLKTLKTSQETRALRVVMVSGKAFPAEAARAQRNGADLYINKPYDAETVADQIIAVVGPPKGGAAA